jgi:Leucine-rich repeat (LRR) protein
MKKNTATPITHPQLPLLLMTCCARVAICYLDGNSTDRLWLLEFKKAITSDPQKALVSWNDTNHFCSWKGVQCSAKHLNRVTSLRLHDQGLAGPISPSLGNLTFLRILILSTNSFTGDIPPSLGHLHRLQKLELANNTLHGRIPSLANCSRLKALWLSNNQLGGQTPADLPHGLELLKLSDNNLTGTIPTSLANTTTLYVFSFTDNSIEGTIPSEFAKLSGMQYLDLG